MNAEFAFRTPGPMASAREGAALFFSGNGYSQIDDGGPTSLTYVRGSRWQRILSLRTEEWPTTLRVLLIEVSNEETGIMLRYEVRSGFHLVGALDKATLEVEAALLEDYLVTGRRRLIADAIAPVRRPVLIATILNMLIAVAVVTWIGVMGNFPLPWVAVAAAGVAFLDGVVIMAFADLILEGTQRMPRLRDPAAGPQVSGSPRPGPSGPE